MTGDAPTMTPKPLGFFSDWYVDVRWPDGQKERVTGFTSEHHARGWIEHESPTWLLTNGRVMAKAPAAKASAAAKPSVEPPSPPKGVALAALTARFEAASQAYAAGNAITRDADWFVLKLQEELGELTQAWMKLTGRGRPRGASEEDLRTALADETADLLGHILLFASAQGIDLDAAIERKWMFKPGE
jgi:NTP pyrophosphatase (non-canonical NTP hydrolase)